MVLAICQIMAPSIAPGWRNSSMFMFWQASLKIFFKYLVSWLSNSPLLIWLLRLSGYLELKLSFGANGQTSSTVTSQVSFFKNISEKIADMLIVLFVFMHLLTYGQLTPYLYGLLFVRLVYLWVKIYKDDTLVNKKKKIIKLLSWTIIIGLLITYLWMQNIGDMSLSKS